jgi:hypothetical protein
MVQIADGIWPAWRERVEQNPDEPDIRLLFAPDGDHREAARAIGEAVREVHAAQDEKHVDDPEPPFVGEWEWLRGPDGVVVQIVECDELDVVLPAVAVALQRRGIAGNFDLYEEPTVAHLPWTAHFLECRVRVRGTRVGRPSSARWQADPAAHEASLAVAQRWCNQAGADAMVSVTTGTVGPVPVRPGEDVLDRLLDAVADDQHAEVAAVTADAFRVVAARAVAGGVSLVAGGGLEWRHAVADLARVLRDHSDLFVYGYIKRGWSLSGALLDLSGDWPDRPNSQPRGTAFTPQSYDDLFAPDAFGVQLLGPGYAGRVPENPSWRREQVGGAVLLHHVDPAAWFDAPFVPLGQMVPPTDRAVPEVLGRARAELAPILYAPGALSRAGYVEDESL